MPEGNKDLETETKLGQHNHYSCPLEHIIMPLVGILVRARSELHICPLISVNQTSKLQYLRFLTFSLMAKFTSSTQGCPAGVSLEDGCLYVVVLILLATYLSRQETTCLNLITSISWFNQLMQTFTSRQLYHTL